MTIQSTITSKGQTTIPSEVRQALGLKPGDKLRYRIGEDGRVTLMPSLPASSASGMLHRPGSPAKSLEEMDAGIALGARDSL